jgi:hypothetical protein
MEVNSRARFHQMRLRSFDLFNDVLSTALVTHSQARMGDYKL